MKLKHFFFLTLFFTFTSTFSYATQADIFVQSTVNRASSLLSENISREEIAEAIKNEFGFNRKLCLDIVNDIFEIIIEGFQ